MAAELVAAAIHQLIPTHLKKNLSLSLCRISKNNTLHTPTEKQRIISCFVHSFLIFHFVADALFFVLEEWVSIREYQNGRRVEEEEEKKEHS